MLVPLLVLHFVAAAVLVYGANQLSLISWRRARDAHWTERARLLWPARTGSVLFFITIPASLTAAQLFFFPTLPLVDLYAGLGGVLGATLGTWPISLAVHPGLQWSRWLRDVAAGFVIRILSLGVLVAAAIEMPPRFGWTTVCITVAVVVFQLWLILGGLLWLLRATGALVAAPPRLTGIVAQVAGRMNLHVPRVWLLRTYNANAIAYPVVQTLVVTEGAVNALDDEELAAVCAHEFAHLNESKSSVLVLILGSFLMLPLIFFKPAIMTWGSAGSMAIGVSMILFPRFIKAFRRRLESRADSAAIVHEGPSPGTYARALEHLYEVNQTPAVISGSLTHPNLYDRMLAAGVTPAYPRPSPSKVYTLQYLIAILLLIASIFAVVDRMEHQRHKVRRVMPSQGTDEG